MSKVQVKVPTPLRSFTGGSPIAEAEGSTVGEVLRSLVTEHRGLEKHLFGTSGQLRNFVTVYLNDQDVRYLRRDATPVRPGDVLSIVPAIAGGSPAEAIRGAGRPVPLVGLAEGDEELGPPLTRDQMRRYSRHLLLPEVGVKGQRKLRASTVLLVGAGGLGAPAALYLAAAGVGEIGLVDFDRVEVSNLQRQVLYGTGDIGRPKLEAARERLNDLNPDVVVRTHEQHLTSENALEILRPYDVIVDGTDNFPTRYLVNDASVLLGKPNVYGSIYRFEGQASVFDARRGPCYRCLYPEPPPPGLVPSCAEGGVLGVLPGLVGTIQATETVKLLLGIGEPLIGRLLLFDALALRFRELRLRKNPECVICGTHPTQTGLIDYPAFCGVAAEETSPVGGKPPQMTPEALAARLIAEDPPMVIDVRNPSEWEIAHLPGATLIPLPELPQRVTELARARELVLYCHTGRRSAQGAQLLIELGFTHVSNLTGGIEAWAQKVDTTMPRY
ncbi:MAG: molybdopterin-synthase adenylyltransferase MoeB [Thermoplasmata archaeon]|nr:molybdopterin-synthase adenylyltransferase MoeB [Thermoplasmata archaeon]